MNVRLPTVSMTVKTSQAATSVCALKERDSPLIDDHVLVNIMFLIDSKIRLQATLGGKY